MPHRARRHPRRRQGRRHRGPVDQGRRGPRRSSQEAALRPSVGRWRIIIIEDADRLTAYTDAPADALLKALEEPTPRTVWMLCAPSLEDVIVTIRSRSRHVRLRTPPVEAVAELLQRRDGVDPAMALYAARAAQSHVGLARRLARDEQARIRRRDVIAMATKILGVGDAIGAAADLAQIADEESTASSAERDAAERARLLETLGADPTARTQPPHIRSQVAALEREQKTRATRAAATSSTGPSSTSPRSTATRSCCAWRSDVDLVNPDAVDKVRALAGVLRPRAAARRDGRHQRGPRPHQRQRAAAAGPRGHGPAAAGAARPRRVTRHRRLPGHAASGSLRSRRGHEAAADRSTGYRFRHDDTPCRHLPRPHRRRGGPGAGAGCCGLHDDRGPGRAADEAGLPAATAAPTQALAPYYAQKLDWKKCGNLECADLRVPLDHAAPDPSKDLTIKVARVKARDQDQASGLAPRQPGRPRRLRHRLRPRRRRHHRRAGRPPLLRPRRLRPARRRPLRPRSTASATRRSTVSSRPTRRPTTPAEEQALLTQAKAMAAGCQADNPRARQAPLDGRRRRGHGHPAGRRRRRAAELPRQVLRHASSAPPTPASSRSASVASSSTASSPPDLTSAELGEGQARGFQIAHAGLRRRLRRRRTAPSAARPRRRLKGLDDFFRQVDRQPLPTGDPSAPLLTEGWARSASPYALYDQGAWGVLTDALREAKSGNGQSLMHSPTRYARATPGGWLRRQPHGVDLRRQLPRPARQPRPVRVRDAMPRTSRSRRRRGARTSPGAPCRAACGRSSPPTARTRSRAAGSDPIVVVGTTRDPATIYEWSKRLRDQLDNAVLVSYDGDGHTAYGRSNTCVDSAIDAYYVQGRVPQDGLRC